MKKARVEYFIDQKPASSKETRLSRIVSALNSVSGFVSNSQMVRLQMQFSHCPVAKSQEVWNSNLRWNFFRIAPSHCLVSCLNKCTNRCSFATSLNWVRHNLKCLLNPWILFLSLPLVKQIWVVLASHPLKIFSFNFRLSQVSSHRVSRWKISDSVERKNSINQGDHWH